MRKKLAYRLAHIILRVTSPQYRKALRDEREAFNVMLKAFGVESSRYRYRPPLI